MIRTLRSRLQIAVREELRSLWRNPYRTLLVCAVLAGAVASVWAIGLVRETVVQSTLPYLRPSELVHVEVERESGNPRVAVGVGKLITLHEQYALRRNAGSIRSLSGWSSTWGFLGEDRARAVRVTRIHRGFLDTLGVVPAVGVPFTEADYAESRVRGKAGAILIGHGLWRRLGGSPRLIGEVIEWNGSPVRVVGVMPADFFFPTPDHEVWVPAAEMTLEGGNRHSASPQIARLHQGVTRSAAASELTAILRNLGTLNGREVVRLIDANEAAVAEVRPALDLLWVGALFLLIVCSVSIGALRLTRERANLRSTAIRFAVGADEGHEHLRNLCRVAIHACLVGLLSAFVCSQILEMARDAAGNLPSPDSWQWTNAPPAWITLLILGSVAVAEAPVISGALGLGRWNPAGGLARSATSLFGGTVLAIGVSAATATLIATTTLGGSALSLMEGRGGYSGDRLVQLTVDFDGGARGLSHDEKRRLLDRIVNRLTATRTVLDATYADALPDGMPRFRYRDDGTASENRESVRSEVRVRPGFLTFLGIPMIDGRGLVASDLPEAERVVVVSDSLARRLAGEPLGRSLGDTGEELRIVGIVENIRRFPAAPAPPATYFPFSYPPPVGFQIPRAEILARLGADPSREDVSALAKLVAQSDPSLRVLRAESVRDRRSQILGLGVLAGFLIAAYGLVAVALSAISCFGHLAEDAALRRRSNAVRIAVGASPDAIVWETSRRTSAIASIGVAVGASVGWFLMRIVGSRIPWVEAGDPFLYAGPTAFLGLCLMAAGGFAAWRASRADAWTDLRAL